MGDIGCGRRPWELTGEGRYTRRRCIRTGRSGARAAATCAAIALRAAGAESGLARPASFFCHYLSVAAFEPVDLRGHAAACRAAPCTRSGSR